MNELIPHFLSINFNEMTHPSILIFYILNIYYINRIYNINEGLLNKESNVIILQNSKVGYNDAIIKINTLKNKIVKNAENQLAALVTNKHVYINEVLNITTKGGRKSRSRSKSKRSKRSKRSKSNKRNKSRK
jgi:hypothetical protein